MSDADAVQRWGRALATFRAGELLLEAENYDNSASRAYYAAFHAVSALFALKDKVFSKHSALEAAVHRDLVKSGRWAPELGSYFSALIEQRDVGDYGVAEHVDREEAQTAVMR